MKNKNTEIYFVRAHYPFDFFVAADLDDGVLVAAGDDDTIVAWIIIHAIYVRPVASRARAHDIALFFVRIHRG